MHSYRPAHDQNSSGSQKHDWLHILPAYASWGVLLDCHMVLFFFFSSYVQEKWFCLHTNSKWSISCILQFRLAYVAPESRVVGAGEVVDQPKKIALNYLKGYFFIDLFLVLPLPQVRFLSQTIFNQLHWQVSSLIK